MPALFYKEPSTEVKRISSFRGTVHRLISAPWVGEKVLRVIETCLLPAWFTSQLGRIPSHRGTCKQF